MMCPLSATRKCAARKGDDASIPIREKQSVYGNLVKRLDPCDAAPGRCQRVRNEAGVWLQMKTVLAPRRMRSWYRHLSDRVFGTVRYGVEPHEQGVRPAVGFHSFHECKSVSSGLPAASKIRCARWNDFRPRLVSSINRRYPSHATKMPGLRGNNCRAVNPAWL
jgi:hypothetical protein